MLFVLSVCVVHASQVPKESKLFLGNADTYLKAPHQGRPVLKFKEGSVRLSDEWASKNITKAGLADFSRKTRKIGHTSDEVKPNKTARFVPRNDDGFRLYCAFRANRYCLIYRLVSREQVESSDPTYSWMIAKTVLVGKRIQGEHWGESRIGGIKLGVNLNAFSNGFTNVSYRQFQRDSGLFSTCENQVSCGLDFYGEPRPFLYFGSLSRLCQLVLHWSQLIEVDHGDDGGKNQPQDGEVEWIGFMNPLQFRPVLAFFCLCVMCIGWLLTIYLFCHMLIHCGGGRSNWGFLLALLFVAVSAAQFINSLLRTIDCWDKIVTQKCLTTSRYCNTVMDMANVLNTEKQTAIISALAEGSSIRSIERITGIHRDTIMRLGVRVGNGCQMLLDSKMQDLGCRYLQFDELWGFIGKKERHVRVDDDPEYGDVWTFCAIDSETKLVPSFLCGKRNHVTANAFVKDVASRMRNQVQISTDALHTYVEAVEQAFGSEVDYGQIVKVYTHDAAQHPERKYSAPQFASAVRRPIVGNPDMELVSTSHIERLNATTRLHVKRLSRLTLAFSKKFDNFKAAVALHFAYYNLVKRHNTLRCTPAMAAGVENDFWTVEQLVEAVS
jgi:IS1 family transposase